MDRFEYSDFKLSSGESYILRSFNIKLYDGNQKSPFESGEMVLTTHRLQWSGINIENKQNVSLALWLKYIVYIEEDEAGGFGLVKSKKLLLYVMEKCQSDNNGPVQNSIYNFVKLSFKTRIDTEFIAALAQAIRDKKWEAKDYITPITGQGRSVTSIKPRTGIIGIERSILEKQKAADESITAAFQDLSKLMVMAKDMVNLSKNISNKLKEKQGDITDDETVKFKSYLLSLGIDDPVTRDAYFSNEEYFQKLSKEILYIIKDPIKEVGGIMVLTDAYCRVNRARGLQLLSPEDFLSGCIMLESLHMPVVLREFDSGVKVLQLTSHNENVVAEDTSNILKQKGKINAEELARMLGISVILAKERLLITEKYGKVCRDDTIEGLMFYPNKFLENTDDVYIFN